MRLVKVLIAVLAAVVALFSIAAIIIASLFDPNDYKSVVTDAFASRTGRTLTIAEDLRLSYFPWLAVETGGVTIGNAPAFGETPFATVQRVAARVKLMPLLDRRIEIGTVELDGLTLDLARDAERRGNWQDLAEAAGGGAQTSAAQDMPSAEDFAVEGIRIRNGTVYWRENTTELRYSVTGLDLTTGSIGGRGEPVSFEASLTFKDEMTGLTAALEASATAGVTGNGSVNARDVAIDATLTTGGTERQLSAAAAEVAFDTASETLRVDGLTTETAGLKASWQLAGTALLTNPALEGSLNVPTAALATVYDELGWSPPTGVSANDLGDVALSSRFRVELEPRTISVSALQASLLGLDLKGEGSLSAANDLKGRVDIAEFAPSPALQALLRSAIPPSVDTRALDKLALSTRFEANLDSGRSALRELKANVFGASVSGTLEAVPGDRGNVFRGTVSTSRFAPDAFAKAFASMLPPNLSPSELGSIQLESRFNFDTGTDTVSAGPFVVELFGLHASGEVAGRSVSSAATWTGTARIAEFSPQELLRRFGLPPQPTSDPRALTRATVDTRFNVTKDRAALTDVVLALDDSKITGNFTLEGLDNPAYRFALVVDRVDADRYLPPKARDANAGEATAGDIELPQNNTMNLDGTMEIGSLTLAGMQFQTVATRVLIGNGDAKLENARARLYGGEFKGNFHVRAAGSEPGLALDGSASGLQLQPLIEALTGEAANFSGTGNFDLDLAGSGRTVIQNVQTASGNVSFAMRDGTIKGFNLARTLCQAYNATQRVAGPGEQPKETAYEVIQGTAAVMAGAARSQDLLARTSFMDIAGRGTLTLVEQRLDYDVDAKLTGKIAIPGCQTMDGLVGGSIPFNIRGTVTEPTITPDFSKLIQQRVRDEVQERLQNRIQDKLRDILR